MNETLRRVLAELPEMRERADKATAGSWEHVGSRVYRAETRRYAEDEICVAHIMLDSNFIAHAREDVPKLCDALQAAADEIERLTAEVGSYIDEQFWREKEKQRLQAVIEQKNAALGIYSDDSNWSSDWGWKGNNDPTLIAKRELGGKQG